LVGIKIARHPLPEAATLKGLIDEKNIASIEAG